LHKIRIQPSPGQCANAICRIRGSGSPDPRGKQRYNPATQDCAQTSHLRVGSSLASAPLLLQDVRLANSGKRTVNAHNPLILRKTKLVITERGKQFGLPLRLVGWSAERFFQKGTDVQWLTSPIRRIAFALSAPPARQAGSKLLLIPSSESGRSLAWRTELASGPPLLGGEVPESGTRLDLLLLKSIPASTRDGYQFVNLLRMSWVSRALGRKCVRAAAIRFPCLLSAQTSETRPDRTSAKATRLVPFRRFIGNRLLRLASSLD